MIVLDTNVISELLRKTPDPTVIAWVDAQAIQTLFLSAITVAELYFGIAALPAGKRRDLLQHTLEKQLIPLFFGRVLSFDIPASQSYGEIMGQARASGRAISAADGYIAATALANGMSVATRDISPFEAAGVEVINPWKPATV